MKNLNELRSFDALKIYLASEDDILSWSYGEITKPETINYRTFKSERDGLFCEKIFGPTKDYECACGKYKRVRYKGVICDKCGVEVTHSRVRRERMGHIKLATPAAHVWFFKGIPSRMALLLSMSPRNLESIIYFSSYIVVEYDGSKKAEAISQIEKDFQDVKKEIESSMNSEIDALEKEIKAIDTKGDSKEALANEQKVLKLQEKIQSIRNVFGEKLEDSEREFKILQKKIESIEMFTVLSDSEYVNLEEYIDMFATVDIGAEAVQKILENLDLNQLSAELKEELAEAKGQKALKLAKRLEVVEGFRKAGIAPSRMIMTVLPVIPPDLRPMVQLEGGRFATSDLNDLYRRVINRNNRLSRLLDLGAPSIIIKNEKRMLQESVDALFDSSKQRQTVRAASRGKAQLRSLADMLKGKQGRFRQNLLGKRVDYSGRSVIVDGPDLALDECGLPKEMALELFKPFVLREILARGLAPNPKSAKYFFESRDVAVWDILEEIVEDHPVLLNRAPTLWRLGIQAFYPKLIEGNAIRLHVCVVGGYNADFDGDQMAVHVPLSKDAIEEAKTKMISTANLLRPADGSPISTPQKSIIFGIYYLTSIDPDLEMYPAVLADEKEAIYLESIGMLKLRQPVKVRINGKIIETTAGRVIFNQYLPEKYRFANESFGKKRLEKFYAELFDNESIETVARMIDDTKNLGIEYGTRSGHSVALSDIPVPDNRDEIIDSGREAIEKINSNYRRGLTTESEASKQRQIAWQKVTDELDDAVWDLLDEDGSVKLLVASSGRVSRSQVKQVGGMKGLITDPTGKVVEMPILGNFKYGLSGLDYFISSRGARKGLADRALKTADSGYLTRRLVDVSQDVLIREHDCGTERGKTVRVEDKTLLASFENRITGRYLSKDAKKGNKIIARKDDLITANLAKEIKDAGIDEVEIRSPLTCNSRRGVCTKCYGLDVMTKNPVALGTAVGVQAAQAIGEPGTQLTMRTFHSGGIAGKDITQGLPRIEELVEARTPKYLAIMAEIDGKAKITESGDERKVYVIPSTKSEEEVKEYLVDPISEILVEDGQAVSKGDKLTDGHLDLTELLSAVGVDRTKKYIIDGIQEVYASQGVPIDDKHIEVIVKQMFNNVRIEESGDTEFLPGQIVTIAAFEDKNEETIAEGGTPATAKVTLLGITKAALNTDSYLSAASFIQTSNVLTDAAASGKVDELYGLKENVIIGRLIPTEQFSEKSQARLDENKEEIKATVAETGASESEVE